MPGPRTDGRPTPPWLHRDVGPGGGSLTETLLISPAFHGMTVEVVQGIRILRTFLEACRASSPRSDAAEGHLPHEARARIRSIRTRCIVRLPGLTSGAFVPFARCRTYYLRRASASSPSMSGTPLPTGVISTGEFSSVSPGFQVRRGRREPGPSDSHRPARRQARRRTRPSGRPSFRHLLSPVGPTEEFAKRTRTAHFIRAPFPPDSVFSSRGKLAGVYITE
jgi:hypothetical protein